MRNIRVGILHSLSGTMASSEMPLVDAALFAIDEINKQGGVLGKKLLGVVEDGCSDPRIFKLKAEKLLEQDGVQVVSGCWTSSSRKAVQGIIQYKNVFLLYPVQYEGLEENPNILYSGSCLNQQISPAIEWCLTQGHENFYLVGSDYVFPRTANAHMKSLLLDHGANIAGEDYLPLGATDFKDVTKSIKFAQPDFVLNTINGDSNAGFFTHYNKSGNEFSVMSFSIAEHDLYNLGIKDAKHYLCWSYFQNLDNKVNQRFLRNFSKYNKINTIVSDPVVMTYSQIRLWSQAVEKAGSLDIKAVREQLHGQRLNSPAGLLEVMPNNHILKSTFIGKQTSDKKFKVIWKSDKRIKPKPWLGMEDVELPSAKLVLDALAKYPNLIHLNTALQTVNLELKKTKGELEKAEGELRTERDLLDEKVSEKTKELQTSEAKYIDLYEKAPDMFASIDAKTLKILRCNRTLVEALGYEKDEIIGQPIFFVYHPDCISEAKKYFQQFVDTGEIHGVELQLERKDGSKFDVSLNASSVRDEEGKVLYSRSIWRDITERKRLEEKLLSERDEFNSILQELPIGVTVLDSEDKLVYINPLSMKIDGYKYDPDNLIGKDVRSIHPKHILTIIEEILNDFKSDKKSFYSREAKRGKRSVEISYGTIRNTKGEYQGLIRLVSDITERKRDREKLEKALEDAKQGERIKSLFLANMSHEIRTPLNAIIGFMELIESTMDQHIGEEEKSFFKIIRNSSERLMRTVHAILDTSQIESGTFVAVHHPLRLNTIITQVMHELQSTAEEKGLKLSYRCDDADIQITGDEYCITQAISNLVDNAIKYTETGKVDISLLRKDDDILLTIQDTGIGISKEYQERMFTPFSQESEGYTKDYQGIGLGLVLTKRYLDFTSVNIDIQSKKGSGTTITLMFQETKQDRKLSPKAKKQDKV